MSRLACTLLAFATTALTARSVSAQANYDGVDLGGRTAMMGGAGVARGSDGATAFINPAGLTRIPGESFSFQTVAVNATVRHIPDLPDPSGLLNVPDNFATSINLRILPNTFCLFLDGPPTDKSSSRSRHKYGICAADSESESLLVTENRAAPFGVDAPGVSHQTGTKWARSTLAMSWALQLTPRTSIGVTARVENSRLEDFSTVTAYDITGDTARMNSLSLNRGAQSWDAGVVVGVSHQFSDVATVGASLSSPSQHFYGVYKSSQTFAASGQAQTLIQDRGDFRYNQPSNLRLGIAFAWPRFNFELNSSIYLPSDELAAATFDRTVLAVEDTDVVGRESFRGLLQEQAVTVVNLMAGMEAFLASDFSIVAGLQTDFSGLTARVDGTAANTLFRQRKSGAHASLGVVSYGAAGSLLLGLRGFYMGGEFLAGDPSLAAPLLTAVPQGEVGLSVVVSGQISFEAVRDTAYRAAAPFAGPKRSPVPKGGEQ